MAGYIRTWTRSSAPLEEQVNGWTQNQQLKSMTEHDIVEGGSISRRPQLRMSGQLLHKHVQNLTPERCLRPLQDICRKACTNQLSHDNTLYPVWYNCVHILGGQVSIRMCQHCMCKYQRWNVTPVSRHCSSPSYIASTCSFHMHLDNMTDVPVCMVTLHRLAVSVNLYMPLEKDKSGVNIWCLPFEFSSFFIAVCSYY